MTLEESSKDVVKQLARVERLQIERSFAARVESEEPLCKETIAAVAVDTQTAGAVHEFVAKL